MGRRVTPFPHLQFIAEGVPYTSKSREAAERLRPHMSTWVVENNVHGVV